MEHKNKVLSEKFKTWKIRFQNTLSKKSSVENKFDSKIILGQKMFWSKNQVSNSWTTADIEFVWVVVVVVV